MVQDRYTYMMEKLPFTMEKTCKIARLGFAALAMLSIVPQAVADDTQPFVSVEENMRQMDKDKDGMVSVQEIRAALEARHGKNYQQALLDEFESAVGGRSCSTPFAQNFY